jgi:hypothetical protein
MRKIVSAVALTLFASCGGHALEAPPTEPIEIGIQQTDLPDARPATAAFVVRASKPLTRKRLRALSHAPGVAEVAGIATRTLSVEGPNGPKRLKVGEVQPLRFRNVAPGPTRDAEFVWTSLILGQAVPTFQAAKELGISEQAELKIDGTPGFKVGAFADNGTPNVVDLLVQSGAEKQLQLGEPTEFVIGARGGVQIDALKRALKKAVPGAEIEQLVAAAEVPSSEATSAATATPLGLVSGGVIGTMRFEILKNGFIRPDPAWVTANIVVAEVPILGTVTCHRLLVPRLAGALGEIESEGLSELIDPAHYGGCYVPRFIDRDATKPLSNHAFGLAIDLNTTTNQLGTKGSMDPRIVEIFRKWGFNWGGYWTRPDPMHFELAG